MSKRTPDKHTTFPHGPDAQRALEKWSPDRLRPMPAPGSPEDIAYDRLIDAVAKEVRDGN